MIWTLEPTAPWRVEAAYADAEADAGAEFLTRFAAADRPLIESTLFDALRQGESSCACTLAPTQARQPVVAGGAFVPARGRLTVTRLRAPSGAAHVLLAQWLPGMTEASVERDVAAAADAPARITDDRALRQFIGSISHDLRSPLNGVLGMSRLLMDSGLRADQIDHARAIDASAEQLLTAIEDLLEFATLDRETTLHPADVDPRQLVDDVIESLSARAAEREIDVCALVSANVPEMVHVDPARLSQVLTWLVDEGIGRTSVGDVVIRVTRESAATNSRSATDDARLRFEVTVEDSARPAARAAGAGVRASAGVSPAVGTAGAASVGAIPGVVAGPEDTPAAAVCGRLVALMGGAIGASTDAATGLSMRWFTVRATPRPAQAHAAAPRDVSLAGRRVLCVDDQPVSRRVLLEQLRAWNLFVEMSDEAHGALTLMKVAAAAGAPFELVIIDLRLPGVDGLSLARLIKQDPVLKVTKLILLTGYPARGQAVAARQAGIDAYLTKPIREAPLRACLEALLNDQPADEHGRCAADRRPLRPRVLVADDHPLNQKVAVQLLQKLGCRVDVADDSSDAIEAVQRTPYHLVLLDSDLPSNGSTFSPGPFATNPGLPTHPPVIVLTGDQDEAAQTHARESGASDVITKPLRLNVLREKLAHWIAATPRH